MQRVCSLSVLGSCMSYCSCQLLWMVVRQRYGKKCRIGVVQMDNLRGLIGITKMDKVPNTRIKELCGVMKGIDERIEGVLRLFGHVERMENDC